MSEIGYRSGPERKNLFVIFNEHFPKTCALLGDGQAYPTCTGIATINSPFATARNKKAFFFYLKATANQIATWPNSTLMDQEAYSCMEVS